ncbi:MAG: hypothetical protein EOO15_07740 [Chitinophagaceae bacterium]|nr:MAG: hypothetical protein EOO15_07740 [Chitinophagaceae bacterium]
MASASLPVLSLVLSASACAQQGSSKSIGLLAGAGVSRAAYLEAGLSKNWMAYGGPHIVGAAVYASVELHTGQRTLLAPKVGGWVAVLPLAIGASVARYSNSNESSWVFKPEAGLGFDRLKITYSWNIGITNKHFDGIRGHSIGLAYCFRLKQLKEQHGN